MTARRYVFVVLIPVCICALAIAVDLLFLWRGGEIMNIAQIAESQQRDGGLYGTALRNDNYQYKFALARVRSPDVVIIGSSRVLNIREQLFSKSMVNMGLVANSAEQLEVAVNEVLQVAHPKLFLIGIDYFWGNSAIVGILELKGLLQAPRRLSPNMLLQPMMWLRDGKIGWGAFWRSLLGQPPSVIANVPTWGWQARLHGDGFAPDGAWIYGSTLYGRGPSADAKFSDTLSRIEHDTGQFRYGARVSQSAVAAIQRTMRRLEDAGVHVVTYMPPLAPAIYAAAASRQRAYGYVEPFRRAVAETSRHHFDFVDPGSFGAPDCEFVDGFHPGEIANARLLARMSKSPLGAFLNQETIQAAIAKRAGFCSLEDEFATPAESEIDFLRLDCRKVAVPR